MVHTKISGKNGSSETRPCLTVRKCGAAMKHGKSVLTFEEERKRASTVNQVLNAGIKAVAQRRECVAGRRALVTWASSSAWS